MKIILHFLMQTLEINSSGHKVYSDGQWTYEYIWVDIQCVWMDIILLSRMDPKVFSGHSKFIIPNINYLFLTEDLTLEN